MGDELMREGRTGGENELETKRRGHRIGKDRYIEERKEKKEERRRGVRTDEMRRRE